MDTPLTCNRLPEWYAPMAAKGGDLAYAEKHKLFDDLNFVAQVKLDGARYILSKNEQGIVTVYSRHISKKSGRPVLKTAQLRHIADEFDAVVPNGTVFDGEVVATGKSAFNLVTTVTGSDPERALQVQQEKGFLLFAAFDILAFGGTDLTQLPLIQRLKKLALWWGGVQHDRYIYVLPYTQNKRDLYETVLENGGEGIILKDLREPYHIGERHKAWIKVKRKKTFDVVFLGIEEAKEFTKKKGSEEATLSRIAGQAGAIRYGQFVPVTEFNGFLFTTSPAYELKELGTVSGFDDAVRADITENANKYHRRVFEVEAQDQFKSGSLQNPRFKQWRDDKRAEECLFRADES